MARKQKPSFYAVAKGRQVGIFTTWPECEARVRGASGAKYKGFGTHEDAVKYIQSFDVNYTYQPVQAKQGMTGADDAEEAVEEVVEEEGKDGRLLSPWWTGISPKLEREEENQSQAPPLVSSSKKRAGSEASGEKAKVQIVEVQESDGRTSKKDVCARGQDQVRTIEVYTDGASSSNGKGAAAKAGWGVYWPEGEDPKSDLYKLNESKRLPGSLQTNNRAELMAIIRAIQLCPDSNAQLVMYTDSQYCIKAINEWQRNWRKNKWQTSKKDPVLNKDLIRLLEREMRTRTLRPTLVYVKGHSTSKGNQEADRLAVEGASKAAIPQEHWRDLEPSDSEDETPTQAHQKAVSMWQKSGFTLEQAHSRAGSKPE